MTREIVSEMVLSKKQKTIFQNKSIDLWKGTTVELRVLMHVTNSKINFSIKGHST